MPKDRFAGIESAIHTTHTHTEIGVTVSEIPASFQSFDRVDLHKCTVSLAAADTARTPKLRPAR